MTEEWCKEKFIMWAQTTIYPDTHQTVMEMLQSQKNDFIKDLTKILEKWKKEII